MEVRSSKYNIDITCYINITSSMLTIILDNWDTKLEASLDGSSALHYVAGLLSKEAGYCRHF